MKQARLLSIRLSPDGLSFWRGDGSREVTVGFDAEFGMGANIRAAVARYMSKGRRRGGADDVAVRVIVDAGKTVIVPAVLFDSARVVDYLRLNNMTLAATERVVVCEFTAGDEEAVSIIVCDGEAVDAFGELFGPRVRFASPFEVMGEIAASAASAVRGKKKTAEHSFATLYLTPHNVYITVQCADDGRWQYCEVLPFASAADILYYACTLAGAGLLDAASSPLFVHGTDAAAVAKFLRKRFTRARVFQPAG
ncbi:MAG: DUF3822 family protein [Rikenellaceae bacterium]|nr:DUF3822 family protein [Rikenellaceae bacterium]MCL2692759.1 DUF3822 family protein [Rikenellaceae bacterium]